MLYITQAGGVAAPVGGQILSEVLPYLELQQDNNSEEDESKEIEVPEFRKMTVEEAKKRAKEMGVKLELNCEMEENVDKQIITEQLPLPGIKINSSSNVYISI